MIPKFSIRQMLLMMIAIGVISACMAGASRGSSVAFGLSVAIVGTILPFAVYAVVHWFSFSVASIPVLLKAFKQEQEKYSKTASPRVIDQVEVPSESIVQVDDDPEQAGHVDA